MEERRPRPRLVERLEARRETHKQRSRAYRVGFAVLGLLILAGGVVMLVTPGPAFVLIPIGLAILALEFAWAERLLEKSLEQAQIAQEKAANTTTLQRVLGALAGLAALAGCIAGILLWDIPLLPDN